MSTSMASSSATTTHGPADAREQFTGTRILYRMLGDPLPGLNLRPGIPTALDSLVVADGAATHQESAARDQAHHPGIPGSGPS